MSPLDALRRAARAPATWYGLATAATFAWSVRRHWFIGDDAYISFRYAQHLVEGYGLVFNPGERVEGYTNFLWVVLMALGMALGADPEKLSLWLGTACGAGVLAVVAWHGSRRAGWASPWTWAAPLCLAVNRSFGSWCSGGLETQLFTLLVVAGLAAFFAEDERRAPGPWGSSLLFALAALTRPEGALFYGIAWLALAVRVARGERTLGALGWYSVVFAPIAGGHEAWRIAYYGAIAPNTFTAKVSGAWWSQGLAWLGFFAVKHVLVVPLALIACGLWRAPRFDVVVTAVIVAIWGVYLAYVGGDRFEFRLLVHALPLLYLLAQHGLRELAATRPRAALASAAVLVFTALLPTFTTYGSTFPKGVFPIEDVGNYAERRAIEGRALARLRKKGLLDDDIVLAVTGAGALPWFAGLETVDLHGLNDAVIARQPVTERGEIGHEKYASREYLVERRVAIWDVRNDVVQLHRKACPEVRQYDSDKVHEPLHCVQGGGYFLVFATTLPDDEFRRRFAGFRIVY